MHEKLLAMKGSSFRVLIAPWDVLYFVIVLHPGNLCLDLLVAPPVSGMSRAGGQQAHQ